MISVSQLIWKIRTTVKARSREGALHLTAEEAAAYASYSPVMSMDGNSQTSEAESQ